MTDEELLAKRTMQLDQTRADLKEAHAKNDMAGVEAARGLELDLMQEVIALEGKLMSEFADRLDAQLDSEESARNQNHLLETQQTVQDGIEGNLIKINELEADRKRLLEDQEDLLKKQENLRKAVVNKDFAKKQRDDARQAEAEVRRFDAVLAEAQKKLAANERGGFQKQLTEREKMAVEADRARQQMAANKDQLAKIDKDLKDMSDVVDQLKTLNNQIEKALTFK